MSLSEVMSSLKYAINSSIGTPDFKTLDQLIKGQNVDLSGVADKSTLDSLVLKVGNTDDLGGGYQTGSVSAKLNSLINTLGTVNSTINTINTKSDSINANLLNVDSKIFLRKTMDILVDVNNSDYYSTLIARKSKNGLTYNAYSLVDTEQINTTSSSYYYCYGNIYTNFIFQNVKLISNDLFADYKDGETIKTNIKPILDISKIGEKSFRTDFIFLNSGINKILVKKIQGSFTVEFEY